MTKLTSHNSCLHLQYTDTCCVDLDVALSLIDSLSIDKSDSYLNLWSVGQVFRWSANQRDSLIHALSQTVSEKLSDFQSLNVEHQKVGA